MISPTAMWDVLQRCNHLDTYSAPSPLPFTQEAWASFVDVVSARVRQAAKRAVKRARRNVDMLRGVKTMYQNLGERRDVTAATLVELLRASPFTLNAGYLDTVTLQRGMADVLAADQGFVFELGWGQAKRDAGRLKTPGSSADLAELVALCRLAVIVLAADQIANRPASLRIISGGRRFYSALFVHDRRDACYNAQRAAWVAMLGLESAISFESIDYYWSQEQITQRLKLALASGVPACSNDEFQFALFSIDWYNVLESGMSPHGMQPPERLLALYRNADEHERVQMLRHLFFRLARQDSGEQITLSALGEDALAASLYWMEAVARESARRYGLLGKLTPRVTQSSDGNVGNVQLTVIEKITRHDIPVLCLLGRRFGATLPQHVTPVISAQGKLEFWPYVMVVSHCAPIFLPLKNFGKETLATSSPQPFVLSALDAVQTLNALMHIDMFDGM